MTPPEDEVMTVGSLFSGIGGLDLGLERAGMTVVWQVEKDPYARRVLEQHWPDVPCFEDIRDMWRCGRNPPAGLDIWPRPEIPDVLCGGFPCQDISNAGKRAGIDGARSGLWAEFARLIGELKPSWVIIENVPALRSRGLGRVLSDLSARGYNAVWFGLRASWFGAPHRRERVFIVAHPNGPILREQPGRGVGADWQNQILAGVAGKGGSVAGASYWAAGPGIRGVDDGPANRVDRLRCLGNAVVPQCAEFIGRLVMEAAEVMIFCPTCGNEMQDCECEDEGDV